jgi:hypothetical protein
MISFVPLRLSKRNDLHEASTSSDHSIDIWKNDVPSSTKYCRPIKFEFKKETHEVITEEVEKIRTQIQNLQPKLFQLYEFEIEINYQMFLTMVDGKVSQALTKTKASSSCIICNSTTSELNKIPDPVKDNPEAYQFGLSPLHARIRLMEFIIKLAYDMEFGPTGNIRNPTNKELRKKKNKFKMNIVKLD